MDIVKMDNFNYVVMSEGRRIGFLFPTIKRRLTNLVVPGNVRYEHIGTGYDALFAINGKELERHYDTIAEAKESIRKLLKCN